MAKFACNGTLSSILDPLKNTNTVLEALDDIRHPFSMTPLHITVQ